LFEFGSPTTQTFQAHYSSVTIGDVIQYTPWFYFDFLIPVIDEGDSMTINFIATGCSLSAHWSELYVDNVGQPPEELVAYGRTVSSIKTGAPLSYQIFIQSPVAHPSIVNLTLDLPSTTFVSANFPAGWTCSHTATLLTCSVSSLSANTYETAVVTVIAPAPKTLAPSVCITTSNLCSPIYPKTVVTN